MNVLRIYAIKIPDSIRSERLTGVNNLIPRAAHDKDIMIQLAKIWFLWVEPDKEQSFCPYCLNNILNNFKNMQEELDKMEQEYKLLNEI